MAQFSSRQPGWEEAKRLGDGTIGAASNWRVVNRGSLPLINATDIEETTIGRSSRSRSSSLSSDGGCRLLPEDEDSDSAASPASYRCSPSPDSRQWTQSVPGSRTASSASTPPTCSQNAWAYPLESALHYLQAIDRSPSPESKKLGDTTYQYRDLHPQGIEIRLLRIFPQTSLQIECELSHVFLSQLPDYVAISYAWGDADDTRSITIDGHDFPITSSLWQALHRLRSDDSVVTVWADAVCINQKDPNERTHQVQKMTNIYASATSVAIWLGLDYDDSHLAIDLILELEDTSQRNLDDCRIIIESPKWRDHLAALGELFQRDYWCRLWIVQEVFSARSVDVYCGSSKLPLSAYTKTSEILQHHTEYFGLLSFMHETTKHSRTRLLFALCNRGPAMLPPLGAQSFRLDSAIHMTSRHKCQDPRDKIYGILGLLAPEERDQIPVDYNLPKRKVYADAVGHILKATKSLDIICRPILGCCSGSETGANIPTWLPGFSVLGERTLPSISSWDRFYASKSKPAATSLFAGQRKLRVLTIPIGLVLIRGISLQTMTSTVGVLVTFLEWRSIVIERYGFEESAHQSFCHLMRVAAYDLIPPSATARAWMEEVYGTIDYLRQLYLLGLSVDEQVNALSRELKETECHVNNRVVLALKRTLPGRRFCITATGRYVLVAGSAHEDDSIYVPLGCSIPIVLRKEGTEYKFIGEAYVDGYMYGLAVDELEKGEKRLESIVLI